MSEDTAGYVYFIRNGNTNRYKIGFTNNLDRRFKELDSSQAAHPLELIWAIVADDMKASEYTLHQRFAQHRVYKEWFEFEEHELDTVREAYDREASQRYEQPYFEGEEQQPEPVTIPSYYPSSSYGSDSDGCIPVLGFMVFLLFAGFVAMSASGGKMSIPQLPSIPGTSIGAQEIGGRAIVLDPVNVREQPTVNSKKLGTLQAGIEVKYTKTQKGWYYSPSHGGWVAGNYLKVK